MPSFVKAEELIRRYLSAGTKFNFKGHNYEVIESGKPKRSSGVGGEPKTDIYVLAKCDDGTTKEFKISYKKENADFLENKMSAERAEEIFGENWEERIMAYTESIKDVFEERKLIYKDSGNHTEKGAINLGWKFEFVDKTNGGLSGNANLSDEEKIEVYSGRKLTSRLRDAIVNGRIIPNSGIADYVIKKEGITSAQEIIDNMLTVEEYIAKHPNVYFVCKALNWRTFKQKYDGDRPLCVQSGWALDETGKLVAAIEFNRPLRNNGNAQKDRLLKYLNILSAKTTDDLNSKNTDSRIIYENRED